MESLWTIVMLFSGSAVHNHSLLRAEGAIPDIFGFFGPARSSNPLSKVRSRSDRRKGSDVVHAARPESSAAENESTPGEFGPQQVHVGYEATTTTVVQQPRTSL